jgi:hypothetical protein
MSSWAALAFSFPGWNLNEIKDMSPRERENWMEVGRELGRLVKAKNG